MPRWRRGRTGPPHRWATLRGRRHWTGKSCGGAGYGPPWAREGYRENRCRHCGLIRRYFDGRLEPWHLVDMVIVPGSEVRGAIWTTYNPPCPRKMIDTPPERR